MFYNFIKSVFKSSDSNTTGILILLLFCWFNTTQAERIEQYPKTLSKDCQSGDAKIYDECSRQSEILSAAIKKAQQTDKTVLVVYGSEWCIWCHVFDQYIHGGYGQLDYAWRVDGAMEQWTMHEQANPKAQIQATVLNRFVAENFIMAHIEGTFSPDGYEVIANTGVDMTRVRAIPFIMVVDQHGKLVARMPDYDLVEGLEIRSDSGKEYRGFDRFILVRELLKLKKAATG